LSSGKVPSRTASILQGSGDRMRHIQLTGVKDMKKKAFKDFVRAAVKLNREKGDPTKRP